MIGVQTKNECTSTCDLPECTLLATHNAICRPQVTTTSSSRTDTTVIGLVMDQASLFTAVAFALSQMVAEGAPSVVSTEPTRANAHFWRRYGPWQSKKATCLMI